MGPNPSKSGTLQRAWEGVSLQRGVDFHTFAGTKKEVANTLWPSQFRAPRLPWQPRHSAKKREKERF